MKRTNFRTTRAITLTFTMILLGVGLAQNSAAAGYLESLFGSPGLGGRLLGSTVARAENAPVNAEDAVLATAIWTGGDNNNGLWKTGSNWSGGGVSVEGDDLVFPQTAQRKANTNDYDLNTHFNSLTFTGTDYVINGTAGDGISMFLDSGMTVNVAAAGPMPVFNPNILLGANQTFTNQSANSGPFFLNGAIGLQGHTLTVNTSCQNCIMQMNGQITGSGTLTKTGPGTLGISDNSGGFGSTNINAGTLFLTGTLGTVNLNSGNLRGGGNVGAIVATGAPANGVLDPSSNSIGGGSATLDATSVTLAATSTLAINIDTAIFYDKLNVNGQNVSLNGASLNVRINYTPIPGQEFTIINETGPGVITGQFAQGTSISVEGRPFTITYTPSSVIIKDVSTPEPGTFDYDGDGKTDVSVFRPSLGDWYIQRSSGGFFGTRFGVSTDKIVPADYDGDGKTDIAVYRPSTGTWFISNSSNGTVSFPVFGLPEDLPAPADYDGDGKADICVFRPSTGTWFRQNSSTGTFFGIQFGLSGDKPTVGDFDGDGKADIGIWRPSNGDWYHIRSSNGTVFGERFGISTDKIVPADYDGDGKTDIAVYRPSSGQWFLKYSSLSSYSSFTFGLPADIPAPGDFDGDGIADVSVFRPSEGNWYRANSSTGTFSVVLFGLGGDRPTPSAFN